MKTDEQNRNNKRTEIKRFDWFIERTQTHLAFGWLSERSDGKTSCPKNFLEIALTSHCNTIGQSNNAFSILGFSLAGKRRVHFLIFSSIGLWNRWRTLTETIFQGHTKIALSYYKTVEKLWQFNFQRQSLPFHHCHRKQQLRRAARGYFLWMCRWTGSHFYDWFDKNGVAF